MCTDEVDETVVHTIAVFINGLPIILFFRAP